MIKTLPRSVCLWLLLGSCVSAQNKVIKLRGTVQDATTKNPVAGATVSASGDIAQQSEITDGKGFFRILIEGVNPGDLVHIRVEKAGYAAYDQQFAASEEIPLNILLRRSTSATPPPVRKMVEPAAPINALTARFIQELKDQHSMSRFNALDALVDSAPTDIAAMSAVIAAALDLDYRIKLKAIYAIGRLKPTSKDAVTNLLVDLHDIEPLVQAQSIDALGSFPKDKDAQAALFRLLGTPPSINERAMSSLIRSGVEDPRLSEGHILRGDDWEPLCRRGDVQQNPHIAGVDLPADCGAGKEPRSFTKLQGAGDHQDTAEWWRRSGTPSAASVSGNRRSLPPVAPCTVLARSRSSGKGRDASVRARARHHCRAEKGIDQHTAGVGRPTARSFCLE